MLTLPPRNHPRPSNPLPAFPRSRILRFPMSTPKGTGGPTRPAEPLSPGREPAPKRFCPLAGRGRGFLVPPSFNILRRPGDATHSATSSVRSTPAPASRAPSVVPSRAVSPSFATGHQAASPAPEGSPLAEPRRRAATTSATTSARARVGSGSDAVSVALVDKGKGPASAGEVVGGEYTVPLMS